MASLSLFMIPAIFITFIISLSNLSLATSHQLDQSNSTCSIDHNNTPISQQVQQLKLKITQLESVLEQSINNLNSKLNYLEGKGKQVEEMATKINFLHTFLANLKVDSTYTEERISALEEEVRLLWAASRKNNFAIHHLESEAERTDERIQTAISKIRMMEDIVTEQWIQIRQLDQALQVTEMRISQFQRRTAFERSKFLKFISGLYGHYLSKYIGDLKRHLLSYVSQAQRQLRIATATIKYYHQELQDFVKGVMEKNEFTAAFANEEVIFFLASSIIVFYLWVAWYALEELWWYFH